MEAFLDDTKHIDEILNQPSGHHMIDLERFEIWKSKLNPTIQKYGQLFGENIQYIRWKDLLENFQVVLHKQAVKKLANPGRKNIWLIANKGNSLHVFGLLAYHYCKLHDELKVLLPDNIITYKGVTVEQMYDHDIYIFDDIAYSGGSIIMIIIALLTLHKQKPSTKMINIHASLCYITKAAHKLFDDHFTSFSNLPFRNRVTYEYAIELPSLAETIGTTDSLIVRYLFNPSSYICDTIVYCDHKMADPVSTFMLTLQYGIIPPAKIDYKLIDDLLRESGDDKTGDLLMKAGIGLGQTAKWSYYPFINGCRMVLPPNILARKWEILMLFNLIKALYEDDESESALKRKYKHFVTSDVGKEYELILAKNNRCPKSFYHSY